MNTEIVPPPGARQKGKPGHRPGAGPSQHADRCQPGSHRAGGGAAGREGSGSRLRRKKAMQEVALVSQLEAQLSALVPMATGRLQAIGDMVALEAADVVSQTVRKVSR